MNLTYQQKLSFQFPRPWLDLEAAYQQQQDVYDGLSFYVPLLYPKTSRTVCVGTTFYELWSPNSTTSEYYPGYYPSQMLPAKHLPDVPYPDGRLGPRDWSLHPQHFSQDALWLGFCRTPCYSTPGWPEHLDAELVPLPVVWRPSASCHDRGCIDGAYLTRLMDRAQYLGRKVEGFQYHGPADPQLEAVLNTRPRFPRRSEMEFLCEQNKLWVWQDLVPFFTSAQRGLREEEAWLTMMRHWESRNDQSPISFPETRPLGDSRIGVWLNGVSERDGLWLLRIGVIPIYIIHRYEAKVDSPSSPSSSNIVDHRPIIQLRDFLSYTRAEDLNSSEKNPYLQAHACGVRRAISQAPRPAPATPWLAPSGYDSSRSSSWAFRAMQQGRGHVGQGNSPAPAPGWRSTSISQAKSVVPEPTSVERPKTAGELRTEGSVSFWIPPPVHWGPEARTSGNGKRRKKAKTTWFHFYEATDLPGFTYILPEGETAMLLRSRKKGGFSDDDDDSEPESGSSQSVGPRMLWDRHHSRCLHFHSPVPRNSQVHYNVRFFGMPLTDMNISYWVDEGGKQGYTKTRQSLWAYLSPHPQSRSQTGSQPELKECRPAVAVTAASTTSSPTTDASAAVAGAFGTCTLGLEVEEPSPMCFGEDLSPSRIIGGDLDPSKQCDESLTLTSEPTLGECCQAVAIATAGTTSSANSATATDGSVDIAGVFGTCSLGAEVEEPSAVRFDEDLPPSQIFGGDLGPSKQCDESLALITSEPMLGEYRQAVAIATAGTTSLANSATSTNASVAVAGASGTCSFGVEVEEPRSVKLFGDDLPLSHLIGGDLGPSKQPEESLPPTQLVFGSRMEPLEDEEILDWGDDDHDDDDDVDLATRSIELLQNQPVLKATDVLFPHNGHSAGGEVTDLESRPAPVSTSLPRCSTSPIFPSPSPSLNSPPSSLIMVSGPSGTSNAPSPSRPPVSPCPPLIRSQGEVDGSVSSWVEPTSSNSLSTHRQQLPALQNLAPPVPSSQEMNLASCTQLLGPLSPPAHPRLIDRLSNPIFPTDPELVEASSSGADHRRRRGKKRGLKKNRGGIRAALHKKFGKPLKDLVTTIADDEFAALTFPQQEYILRKKSEYEVSGNMNVEGDGLDADDMDID